MCERERLNFDFHLLAGNFDKVIPIEGVERLYLNGVNQWYRSRFKEVIQIGEIEKLNLIYSVDC